MKKKLVAVMMMAMLSIAMLTGCQSSSLEEPKDNTKVEVKDESSKAIEVTDLLGREVKIEKRPEKVIANKCGLRLYMYAGDKSKLVGIEKIEQGDSIGKPYVMANEDIKDRPIIGQGGANNTDDYEKILQVKPDVIFTAEPDKKTVDNLQEKTGIPVVALSYGKSTLFDPAVYESLKLIGKVMGTEDRANKVVEFMDKCKDDLNERTKDIPEDERPTVYIGGLSHRGSHGIESTRESYPIFEAVNARNVVQGINKPGPVMIDKEKLLQWNPDKIILDLGGIELIQKDMEKDPKYYESLKAFKDGQVFTQLPYIWYSVNVDTALVDAYYSGKAIYPEKFEDIDMAKKAAQIYEFMDGKDVYDQMKKDYYGGFGQYTIEEIKELKKDK